MLPNQLLKEFHSIETPFYYYDIPLLEKTLSELTKNAGQYGYKIHYALKANVNDRVLKTVVKHGLGADCVSGNEIQKALGSGFMPRDIVFAGVGKTDKEIALALQHKIFCFNIESLQELRVINDLAGRMGFRAPVALRINPNVHAHTHDYITTGLEENKFGIQQELLPGLAELLPSLENLRLVGLHFHIGSQVTDLSSYRNLCVRAGELLRWFRERNIVIEHVNMGGGLGVDYHDPDNNPVPPFSEYFAVFNRFMEIQPGQRLHFELGRSVVAQCGSLISRVLYVKEGTRRTFLILDAGMTELIRPALYQAFHKIENLTASLERHSPPDHEYDVAGPVCESSDCFGKSVSLPSSERGDIIAVRSAGAYGEVMSSSYNLREKVRAVYTDELGKGK